MSVPDSGGEMPMCRALRQRWEMSLAVGSRGSDRRFAHLPTNSDPEVRVCPMCLPKGLHVHALVLGPPLWQGFRRLLKAICRMFDLMLMGECGDVRAVVTRHFD